MSEGPERARKLLARGPYSYNTQGASEARTEEGRRERGAQGRQPTFRSGAPSSGKKVGAPILPLNTEFLSTQSEDDEKIPLIQKEQLGRICVQFAFLEPRASREGT